MSDDIWRREEIRSPCVKICVIHPDARLCTGCLRSPDEIASWQCMTPEARERIMSELPSRKPLMQRRRGGRAAKLKRTETP